MRFLFLGLLALSFSSCLTPPDCLVTATNRLTIHFYKKVVTNSRVTYKDTAMNFLYIKVSGTDSIYYENVSTAIVKLPVNTRSDRTTFTLYQPGKSDTVAVTYQARNLMISPECGAYVYYQNLYVPGSSYANVVIASNLLSTSVATNIEVRF